jgi:uncharacterized protein (TIGR02996 family)
MRTFTHRKEKKVWTVARTGTRVTTTWSRIGDRPRTTIAKHKNKKEAIRDENRRIREKLVEGYDETTPLPTFPALPPEGQALEQALVEAPDDLGAHMAYADWLSEQPDPLLAGRGELIQVQMAREDESKTPAQKRKLTQRLQKLLPEQQRAWLGELAPFLLDGRTDDLPDHDWGEDHEEGMTFTFARGWVSELHVGYLTEERAEALARSPALRLLRNLTIDDAAVGPEDLDVFAGGHNLDNVRRLCLPDCGFFPIHKLVALLPRLEELELGEVYGDLWRAFKLPSLDHLRSLHIEGADRLGLKHLAGNPALAKLERLVLLPREGYGIADVGLAEVRVLARSPHLTGLRHLKIGRSEMGDAGVREIIESGLLKRLRVLELPLGCVTDVGARALAACPEVRRLELLGLTRNRLTEAGLTALAETGVTLSVGDQQEADEDGDYDDDYLFDDDYE